MTRRRSGTRCCRNAARIALPGRWDSACAIVPAWAVPSPRGSRSCERIWRRRRRRRGSLEFGGNDCDYDWAQVAQRPLDPHQPKTPLEIFLSQLREMVHLAKQKGMEPVMMTLPPIHAERYFNFFTRGGLNRENILLWLGDIQFIYRWHERYNAAVIRVAKECGCLLADVREAFLGQRHYEDLLCADGIHPNEKGHILMDGVLEDYGGVLRRPLAAAE